ncbi:hypothetical protein GQX74_009509 [Glossina fuscipes]|nr:hypothetical protein GQX74_009509 [Glossina fuscipes]
MTTSAKQKRHEKDQAEMSEVGLSDLMLDELYTSCSLKQRTGVAALIMLVVTVFYVIILHIVKLSGQSESGGSSRLVTVFPLSILDILGWAAFSTAADLWVLQLS